MSPQSDATGHRRYTAAAAMIGDELVQRPVIEVAEDGTITAIASDDTENKKTALRDREEIAGGAPPLFDLGRRLLLPGLVNGHSHAFQRMIRGATHRRSAGDPSDFWSWRQAMYRAAQGLDPEGLYAATRACYAEMLGAGITCVGEFHYLHHQADGRAYDDPCELSKQVVRAAADVGIRLVLLEVLYRRAGAGRDPEPEQRRFCDPSVDAYLQRVDTLRAAGVEVGLAPHSVRAVAIDELRELAAYATTHSLVIHAHVSEQPRENQECVAEHGRSPVAVFAASGCLDRPRSFTAVHAIHIDDGDRGLLRRQHVCACPTTEADLGDGIVGARDLRRAGTELCLGSDSNAVIDLIQEARLLEMHERLRAGARLRLADDETAPDPRDTLGRTLLTLATAGGASALGRHDLGALAVGRPFDAFTVDLGHPLLADVEPTHWIDALLLAGTAAPVDQVYVAGIRRR